MAHIVVLPKLGLTMEEGSVEEWLIAEGGEVSSGQTLLVVQSDKAAVEVEAMASGVLRRVLVEPGVTVPVGTPVGIIAGPDEDISALDGAAATEETEPAAAASPPPGAGGPAAAPAAPQSPATEEAPTVGGRVLASPLAKRIAREHGLDLSTVAGTGSGGRVRRQDALAAIGRRAPTAAREPLRGLRRETARAVAQSKAMVPHFYASREVDVTFLLRLREALNEDRKRSGRPRLSVTVLIAKLTAAALRQHPALNVLFDGETVERREQVDLAVAVGMEEGVVAPIVRGVDRLSLDETAARLAMLGEQARRGRLAPDSLAGGSFTLSNLGMFGLDAFIPIVNAPQGAILAVGRVAERAAVRDGAVVPARCLWLTLSADHRVIDGLQAAAFLEEMDRLCRNPLRAFAEGF